MIAVLAPIFDAVLVSANDPYTDDFFSANERIFPMGKFGRQLARDYIFFPMSKCFLIGKVALKSLIQLGK